MVRLGKRPRCKKRHFPLAEASILEENDDANRSSLPASAGMTPVPSWTGFVFLGWCSLRDSPSD